uniref:HNH endonuclease n=1 Tax=Trichocoleus desertorum TaxID=1481672 RepID=UPI0025B3D8DA|nr:HNH endonuclease [Trichocoleus desertorum]
MEKKLNSSCDEPFNELFDEYWKWLLDRFKSLKEGGQICYGPINGNTRYVKSINREVIELLEKKAKRGRSDSHRSPVDRNKLRDDFYKLCHDPEVTIRDPQNRIKEIRRISKRHDIENFAEFKREMFEEFEKFARENHFNLLSYRKSELIHIELENLSDDEIDKAIKSNRLLFDFVVTDDRLALQRQRRGQERLRELTLENYDFQCAICDITDPDLLIASHIVRWADSRLLRGKLSNVICLCRLHDALFEQRYWSLRDDFSILIKASLNSNIIELVLNSSMQFRKPKKYLPEIYFLQKHRSRCQLN